jgi:signal transduction histidine kinase
VVAIAGELDPALVGECVPIDGSVSGAVFRSGRTERLRDARSRLRFALAKQTQANTGLFVPLRFHGRVLGVLAGFDRLREGPEFSAQDESLLSSFAVSAAAAVANAQDLAAEALRRSIAAAEEERARWARELHDETLQELAVLKLLLAPVRRLEDPREREAALEQVTTRIDCAIGALRSLITDLRPAALDDYDLKSALAALTDRAARGGHLRVDLRVELAHESGHELPRLAPQIEDTLYRVVQEALSNVVKHADATRAEVVVLEDDGIVEVVVRDDGHGFDPEQKSTGFGLLGMQERAALIDGTITIEPLPGTGTLVRLAAPALRAGQSSLRSVSAQYGS